MTVGRVRQGQVGVSARGGAKLPLADIALYEPGTWVTGQTGHMGDIATVSRDRSRDAVERDFERQILVDKLAKEVVESCLRVDGDTAEDTPHCPERTAGRECRSYPLLQTGEIGSSADQGLVRGDQGCDYRPCRGAGHACDAKFPRLLARHELLGRCEERGKPCGTALD